MIPRAIASSTCCITLLFVLATSASAGVPQRDVHELNFRVHQNLINANGMPFYQDTIADALRDAGLLLEGDQGPPDSICCSKVTALSITAYSGADASRPADDLEIIDFDADLASLMTIAGGQPTVFFADSLSLCGSVMGAIGCAQLPNCQDPVGLISVVTTDALDVDALGATIAHERGHNSCLPHVTNETCELMAPFAGGGCFSAGECTTYQSAATGVSGTCECHANATDPAPDGLSCTENPSASICSGGICDVVGSSASVRLFAAADSTFAGFGADVGSALYDDGLNISASTGGWSDDLDLQGGLRPTGLAYDFDADILYGVAPSTGGDGTLARINPETGAVISSLTLSGRGGLIALAFDPGPTSGSGDDKLIAVDRRALPGMGNNIEERLIELDPSTGAVSSDCQITPDSALSSNGFFLSLAFDAANQVLYSLGPAGLVTIIPGSCARSQPIAYPVPALTFARDGVGMAWSNQTGQLYILGNQRDDPANLQFSLFDAYDPVAASIEHASFPVHDLTAGGLAALPVPAPGSGASAAVALLALGMLAGQRQTARPQR